MTIQHAYASPRGFYTDEGRAMWEIEVDRSLRELHVLASNDFERRRNDYDLDYRPEETVFIKAPGIRIRDMYCGELKMAERDAIALNAAEARQLAISLLAAAEEYERYLRPAAHAAT